MNTNMNMNANANMNVNANVIVCLPYQPDFILLGNRMKFLSECVFCFWWCPADSGPGASFFYTGRWYGLASAIGSNIIKKMVLIQNCKNSCADAKIIRITVQIQNYKNRIHHGGTDTEIIRIIRSEWWYWYQNGNFKALHIKILRGTRVSCEKTSREWTNFAA